MSVFALENSDCKTFWKTAENPVKDCNFLFLSGFFFEFCKIFLNRRFSEHRHGFSFARTYCLYKEEVLGGSGFDTFSLIVSFKSSSITINL